MQNKIITFNKPLYLGSEKKLIDRIYGSQKISGNGKISNLCIDEFKKKFNIKYSLLTPSATHSLELAALLINIKKGDEVIMPSYTFVSTANAFALRGAKIIFVDINSETMNIDENLIEKFITKKTKAIVVVHYAGISCDMKKIMNVAKKKKICVIEDAAQCIDSYYKKQQLGTIGDIGVFSFHETKNITSAGEGGLIIFKSKRMFSKAQIYQEKGTNRTNFFKGKIKKYSWIDLGSSFLMNEISAGYLLQQIKNIKKITNKRLKIWNYYFLKLNFLQKKKLISLPKVPKYAVHNGHIFYIKLKNAQERQKIIQFLKKKNIHAVTHYEPLHSSLAGKKYGKFRGKDLHTTAESKKILRLPMYFELNEIQQKKIINTIKSFFIEKRN
jgi:dTDP-4-amino-4,6-dideoxygalactose transaminase